MHPRVTDNSKSHALPQEPGAVGLQNVGPNRDVSGGSFFQKASHERATNTRLMLWENCHINDQEFVRLPLHVPASDRFIIRQHNLQLGIFVRSVLLLLS